MKDGEQVRPIAGALDLLDRKPPAGYIEQWTTLLAQPPEQESRENLAVVVFRLGVEWMALPCDVFREFTGAAKIHRVPHRSGHVLLGIVNIRGELQLAVSLHRMLEMEETAAAELKQSYERMAVLVRDDEVYVAPVDEVYGLHRLAEADLQPAPVTVQKASATHTKGLFVMGERSVALLDEELVFYNLRRHVE